MLLDCLCCNKQETVDCERKTLRCDHKLSTSSPSLISLRQLNAISLCFHPPLTQDTLAYPPKAKTEASLQTSEADIIIYGLKKEGKAREEVHFVPGKSCSPQGPIL